MWKPFSILLAVGLPAITIAWGKVQPLLAFVAAALASAAGVVGPPAQSSPWPAPPASSSY